jgi:hypothetical protein
VDNRYYLQALGVTGLFVTLLILFWIASGGPASEAAVQNANDTRTAIAMTGSYLLQPRTRTPLPITSTPTSLPQTSIFGGTSTIPSATNTSLLPQPNIPISPVAASLTPLPTQTAVAQLPVLAATKHARKTQKPSPLPNLQLQLSFKYSPIQHPNRIQVLGRTMLVFHWCGTSEIIKLLG